MTNNHSHTFSEAATNEPASVTPPAPGEAEAPPRRPRHDGWTPERQAAFLAHLADCGTVAEACRAVGLSPQSAYAFRKSRNGRGFAIGWDAALLHARALLADSVFSRALHGTTETLRRDGEIVGERHRFDNRLAMAVLTRLDTQAERIGKEADTSRIVAGDFEDYLDCLAEGGDVLAFVEERRPPVPVYGTNDPKATAPIIAELRRERERRNPPYTHDLDPTKMASWTDDQWERADRSGLLDEIPDELWPQEEDGEPEDKGEA